MTRQHSTSVPSEVMDTISSFLADLPEGTPVEIIEAFDAPGAREFLPPKLFLESVEQAPVAISITDPSARILYVNAAFEQLSGYRREEVVGKNESVLSSRSTPISVYQELWETIQDRRVWQGTLVNHRKNKQEYVAELVVSPVLNPEGQIAYFLGMHRDMTELHQLGQRLKFQKRLTEAVLDSAPVVVAMVGAERKVLLDNHAYKALLGDFRGTEPAHLFLDALEQHSGLALGDVCQVGAGFNNIEVRLDPQGSGQPRWFTCSGVRLPELDEAAHNYFKRSEVTRCCLLLVANEITISRNRLNRARLNLIRANMAEQQMVETMREAIIGAIFKLQVPLNVIKAALAMPDSSVESNTLHTALHQAQESGDEAIDSLYEALPSPTAEQTSQVNINEILHEVLRLSTDRLLASSVVVDWYPAPVLPPVTGRVNALRGLFKYLIDNAVQALNESDRSDRELRIETKSAGRELFIKIMDNGPGMTEAYRFKAFEPFFCGWIQPGKHAGMGLTMAREVAMSHGGNIELDDHFFGGCGVIVSLPVAGTGRVKS